jgi:two-component system NtrC family response regulator
MGVFRQDSPFFHELSVLLEYVADTQATVLLLGESGVGKGYVARAIHNRSSRRTRPFIQVSCAALPNELLEAELFGYERGAFTGAVRRKPGKFDLAHGGTLFLDEVGELPLPLQAKLLHVLQDSTFSRLGGEADVQVDVRVIAASNRDLEAGVRAGSFRADLYYRLNVVRIAIPPLRERREEIPGLARFFHARYCTQYGRTRPELSPDIMETLMTYAWPGNIRELENCVKRAVIMAPGKLIQPADLGIDSAPAADELPTLREARSQREREVVVNALVRTKGNISEAARDLGVSRPTFHGLLNKYQVNARDFR